MFMCLHCRVVAISLVLTASLACGAEILTACLNSPGTSSLGIIGRAFSVGTGGRRAGASSLAKADYDAAGKNIVLVDAATGERIRNVIRVEVQPRIRGPRLPAEDCPGEYYVYYLPYTVQMAFGGLRR